MLEKYCLYIDSKVGSEVPTTSERKERIGKEIVLKYILLKKDCSAESPWNKKLCLNAKLKASFQYAVSLETANEIGNRDALNKSTCFLFFAIVYLRFWCVVEVELKQEKLNSISLA